MLKDLKLICDNKVFFLNIHSPQTAALFFFTSKKYQVAVN